MYTQSPFKEPYGVGINEREMMNKQDLNNKLAELYELEPRLGKLHLIDDSARMFELAVQHKIGFVAMNNIVLAGKDDIGSKASYREHESPQAAARYALAMALIKLAEIK